MLLDLDLQMQHLMQLTKKHLVQKFPATSSSADSAPISRRKRQNVVVDTDVRRSLRIIFFKKNQSKAFKNDT